MGYLFLSAAASGLPGHGDPGSDPRREPTRRGRPSPQASGASPGRAPLRSAERLGVPTVAGRPTGASGGLTSDPFLRGSGADPRQGDFETPHGSVELPETPLPRPPRCRPPVGPGPGRLRRPARRRGPGLAARGVPVAYEVARALDAPLDVLLVRKLGVPGRQELAFGALATGGVRVLNEDLVQRLGIPPRVIAAVTAAERTELQRRRRAYRGQRRPPAVRGRIVILIDDGVATGASLRAALAVLRRARPARIVVAVPVAAPEACARSATRSMRSSVPGLRSRSIRWAIGTRTSRRPATGKSATCSEGPRAPEGAVADPGSRSAPGPPEVIGPDGTTRPVRRGYPRPAPFGAAASEGVSSPPASGPRR